MVGQARILSVGVAVIDLIMNMKSLPREAEKYRCDDLHVTGGGCAANAAVAIARLGGESHLATRVGDDMIADLIISDLERESVDCRHVHRFEGLRSSLSSIYIDGAGERQIVNFRDTGLPLSSDWIGPVEEYDALLCDTRWPEAATALARIGRDAGLPVVIDAEAPFDGCEAALANASHVFFSASGLRQFTGMDDLGDALRASRPNCRGILGVTDGPNGVLWLEHETLHNHPAFPVDTVDTLGAGDVWHGAFTLALAEKFTLHAAVQFASAAAALKCARPGGRDGTPSRHEVQSFLERYADIGNAHSLSH